MFEPVKNYYALEEPELTQAIRDMRGWLFKFAGHEKWWRVWYALEVAVNAKEILEDRKTDPLLQETIDIFV